MPGIPRPFGRAALPHKARAAPNPLRRARGWATGVVINVKLLAPASAGQGLAARARRTQLLWRRGVTSLSPYFRPLPRMESGKHFRPMHMRLILLCTVIINGCTAGGTPPRLIPSDLAKTGATLYVIDVFSDLLEDGPSLINKPTGESGAAWIGQQALQLGLRAVRRDSKCQLKRLDHFELTDGEITRLWPDEPVEYEDRLPGGEIIRRATGIRQGFDVSLKPSKDANPGYVSIWFDVARVTVGSDPPEIFRIGKGPSMDRVQIAVGRQTIPIGGALMFRVPVSDLRELLILVSIASIHCR